MISMNKKYQTRDGQPVELLTTRSRESRKWPVMGYIGDCKWVTFWGPEGIHDVNGVRSNLDLVEVKPKRVLWLNVYPDGDSSSHESREDADECAGARRIARLKVEFGEGRFDE